MGVTREETTNTKLPEEIDQSLLMKKKNKGGTEIGMTEIKAETRIGETGRGKKIETEITEIEIEIETGIETETEIEIETGIVTGIEIETEIETRRMAEREVEKKSASPEKNIPKKPKVDMDKLRQLYGDASGSRAQAQTKRLPGVTDTLRMGFDK